MILRSRNGLCLHDNGRACEKIIVSKYSFDIFEIVQNDMGARFVFILIQTLIMKEEKGVYSLSTLALMLLCGSTEAPLQ